MYTIEARWAGYVLQHRIVTTPQMYEEALEALEEDFLAGMTIDVYGVQVKISVLCIDVFHNGKLIKQMDFKK